ncbi:MAG: hypothetical protein ACJ0QX_01550 [Gammaproteobacteria bacterium]|tara:strand:- start:28333 stop:30354 length:2022 start_codon:yes stop_codon:yes gene_type:complete
MLIKIFKYLLISLPLFIASLWHLENGLPAVADGAAYLETSMYIANFWHSGNYSAFLDNYFTWRGWRPILFPNIVAPFLIVTNDVLLGTMLTHLFCNAVTIFFTYKIFSLSLGKLASAVCTSFICMSISVYFGGLDSPLFSEIAFIPVVLGTLYYLHMSNNFQNKKGSLLFSLFLFLCIAIRPAQSVIHITLPIFGYFIYKAYSGEINIKESSRAISIIIFSALIIFLSRVLSMLFLEGEQNTIYKIDPPKSGEIFVAITCLLFAINIITASIYVFYKKKFTQPSKNYLLISISIFSILMIIYWYPFISNLYNWVYANSFGHLVNFYVKPDIGLHMWFHKIFFDGGYFQYMIIFTLFSFTFLRKYIKKIFFKAEAQANTGKIFKFEDINLLLFLTIPIPFLTFFTTPQDHFRIVSIAIFCTLILMLTYIFKNANKNMIFSTILVSVLIKFLGFNTMIFANENNYGYGTNEGIIVESIIGRNMPAPINLKPHPAYLILDELNKFVLKNENNHIKQICKPASGFERVDTFILSTLSKDNKYDYNLAIPIPKKNMIKRNHHDQMSILDNCNAILLTNPAVVGLTLYLDKNNNSVTSDFKASEDTIKLYRNIINNTVPQILKSRINQSLRFHVLVSYLYLTNNLEKYNWGVKECFEYKSIDFENKTIVEKACIATKLK